jgi:WD40 repeat protein
MATSHSAKRHKMVPDESEASLPIQAVVNVILNVDRDAFKDYARNMDRETFRLLSVCLSELGQDMEDTLTKFVDIPPIVIASNVFPYLENRTDWNNFSLVNKDINDAATKHKQLTPPWPEGILRDGNIEGTPSLASPTFSPDGQFIACGDEDGNIYLWNRKKGLVTNWHGHDNDDDDDEVDDEEDIDVTVENVAFSPDGNLLVTVSSFKNIKIWDLANDYRCLNEWTQYQAFSVVFSPDGKYIATAGGSTQPVYLRSVSDGTTARLIRRTLTTVYAVTFSPDGQTLAVGGLREDGIGSVELWNLDSAQDAFTNVELRFGSLRVSNLVYSPNGAFLAIASVDGTIKLWDVATNRCVQNLKTGTNWNWFRSISFTPDGNFFATADEDGQIRLWSLSNGSCIETFKTSLICKVEFSSDSRILLTDEDGSIHLRSMDTCMLEELKVERDNLLKLTIGELQQGLNDHYRNFDPASTKVALVDNLVTHLDQDRRKEILIRCNATPG